VFVLPFELQLFGYILIFSSILFLAYVAARFVGKKTLASMQSKHMQLVEQISLGLDKRLILVRVGTEYFLFLSGKKEFKQVAKVKLDKEAEQAINEGESETGVGFDFNQIYSRYISGYNDKRKKNQFKRKTKDVEKKHDKSEIIKENIQKLEHLREKSYDKEV